jgi:hypothetical protein
MAKARSEIRFVMSCTNVNRPRGGSEAVVLQGMAGAPENAEVFGPHQPNISMSITFPPGSGGQGIFDPELDYEVVLKPRTK